MGKQSHHTIRPHVSQQQGHLESHLTLFPSPRRILAFDATIMFITWLRYITVKVPYQETTRPKDLFSRKTEKNKDKAKNCILKYGKQCSIIEHTDRPCCSKGHDDYASRNVVGIPRHVQFYRPHIDFQLSHLSSKRKRDYHLHTACAKRCKRSARKIKNRKMVGRPPSSAMVFDPNTGLYLRGKTPRPRAKSSPE